MAGFADSAAKRQAKARQKRCAMIVERPRQRQGIRGKKFRENSCLRSFRIRPGDLLAIWCQKSKKPGEPGFLLAVAEAD